MVQTTDKNLWVAASDGDFERVQYLIENEGCTPNDKDANSYTPMHAAASYAHLPLLEYLLSKGGNVNLTDDDGETPLYVVESLDVARFLVEKGADPGWKNEEGLTPAQQLQEDVPEVAAYLRGITGEAELGSGGDGQFGGEGGFETVASDPEISQLALENYASAQSATVLEEAQKIMEECAREGIEPDDRLREILEKAVRDGLLNFGQGQQEDVDVDGDGSKRARGE